MLHIAQPARIANEESSGNGDLDRIGMPIWHADRVTNQLRPPTARTVDGDRLDSVFGRADLLSLWIAEPYVPLAPDIRDALVARAETGWYGYEPRPELIVERFRR